MLCIISHLKALTDFSPSVSNNVILFFFSRKRHGKLPLILYLQPCALMKPFSMAQCEGEGRESVVQIFLFDHTCRPSPSKAQQSKAGKDFKCQIRIRYVMCRLCSSVFPPFVLLCFSAVYCTDPQHFKSGLK